jgi:hypothetical protein
MDSRELYKQSGRIPATKTKKELQKLRKTAAAAIAAGGVGNGGPVACWFKDPDGSDQCVGYPDSDSCTAAGGVPVAGNCPDD